jgi:predicted DNA binding CopG/RHH family protein
MRKIKESIMTPESKIESTDDAWDADGGLGESEQHVRRSSPEREQNLDASLELQMISVRLQKELLEQLKFIANHHGIGYQPLMRDVLARWARTEMLDIAEQMKQQLEAEDTIAQATKKRACA